MKVQAIMALAGAVLTTGCVLPPVPYPAYEEDVVVAPRGVVVASEPPPTVFYEPSVIIVENGIRHDRYFYQRHPEYYHRDRLRYPERFRHVPYVPHHSRPAPRPHGYFHRPAPAPRPHISYRPDPAPRPHVSYRPDPAPRLPVPFQPTESHRPHGASRPDHNQPQQMGGPGPRPSDARAARPDHRQPQHMGAPGPRPNDARAARPGTPDSQKNDSRDSKKKGRHHNDDDRR